MSAVEVGPAARRPGLFGRIARPRSVAIIGMSSKPGSASHTVLRNLLINEFNGELVLFGRTAAIVEGLPIRTDDATMPRGLDLAVIMVPASGVGGALALCAARDVGAAVIFASGFAELGAAERREQERLAALAAESGVAVIGPNCIGYGNYVDGFSISFTAVNKLAVLERDTTGAVAVIAQSGGLSTHMRLALENRGVPVSYVVSTGNEMDLGLSDFVDFFIDDPATRVIMIYAEDIRRPAAFLDAARRVRAAGKVITMLHPGRSSRAQEATLSHTGALAGDYAVMRAHVESAGVIAVETLDALVDVSEIVARYPDKSGGGLGVVSFSGAFCAIALDLCDEAGVSVPTLSAQTQAELTPQMPAFIPPKNPLDLGTQPLWQPEIVGIGVRGVLGDESIGAAGVCIPAGAPQLTMNYVEQIVAARRASQKPLVLSVLGDGSPLAPEVLAAARAGGLIFSRSSDRMLRALATVVNWSGRPDVRTMTPHAAPLARIATLAPGSQPEWIGKELLATAGIRVPNGGLATSADDAVAIAARIGYPVVLKAQSAELTHKTDAGGVALNISDDAGLRSAWASVVADVTRARPDIALDGMLIETMADRGLELFIGARWDSRWGATLVAGVGGVLIEALNDVRLLMIDSSPAEIRAELRKLKTAQLLDGFRGMPAVDLDAVVAAIAAIGTLMQANPAIREIDVNPLVAYGAGRGVIALDAVVITA